MAAAAAGLAGVGAALGVAACGGGTNIPATITTNLPGPITTASTPSTASTQASTASTATTAATTATAGGAAPGTTTGQTSSTGGTRSARVPAIFTLKGGRLTPPTISIPAFLAAQVTVTTTEAGAHSVMVKAGKGYTFTVPARGSGTVKVPGQKAGNVQVLVDGKALGTLSWGGEPGP
jgi:hypothetical protein